MQDRIKKLRDQSRNAIPTLSIERAKLMTEFYKSGAAEKVSVPVARALAFKYLLEKKEICINDDELIIGERGPAPKATPTYPEICCHSMKDLGILDSREKISFKVNEETRNLTEEVIIPFWKGRSIRDRIFSEVDYNWIETYEAGVFTEFMEQRAPGHTVSDGKIFVTGFSDYMVDIQKSFENIDYNTDSEALDKREELKAMEIASAAIMMFAERHAEKAKELAKKEKNQKRKKELELIAKTCNHVPANAPRTFREALQHYWFIHLGVIIELNTWDSFNPGRLDQHLYPFYKKEIAEGTLTKKEAKELLEAFWIKFNNQPAPPKVGVTAEESNTYTD
ncbi:MAG: pyruvate formate lyase family protein, partial [Candidatus Heimdallarchaeota archaeon]